MLGEKLYVIDCGYYVVVFVDVGDVCEVMDFEINKFKVINLEGEYFICVCELFVFFFDGVVDCVGYLYGLECGKVKKKLKEYLVF